MSAHGCRKIKKQGPCALCGGPYAAHRTIDVQMERVIAGDDIEDQSVREMVDAWASLMGLLADA